MNDTLEALKWLAAILIGILVTIVGWFSKDTRAEMKLAMVRIAMLEKSVVTRADLAATLDRLEARQQGQHGENRELLERIENKIDANEERASRTRHDTNESVHALAMEIAVLRSQGTPR